MLFRVEPEDCEMKARSKSRGHIGAIPDKEEVSEDRKEGLEDKVSLRIDLKGR